MQKQVLFFCHEKLLALYDQSASQRKVLEAEYEDIRGRLETLLEQGAIDEYTKCTIVDMSWRVLENIARDYENVKKGVKSIMGGKVLDYEAKRIKTEGRTEGRREGRREGRKEGKLEALAELVRDNILSVQEAASRANLTETGFREFMQNYGK